MPMREIALNPTKSLNGDTEETPPSAFTTQVDVGRSCFRRQRGRWPSPSARQMDTATGDVEKYDGRQAKPIDNGYLSETHAEHATQRDKGNRLTNFQAKTGRLLLRRSSVTTGASRASTRRWNTLPSGKTWPSKRESRRWRIHSITNTGNPWGASIPKEITRCPGRGRQGTGHHPGQH